MLETTLKLLNKIEDYGYQAYAVGGFVRDYVLGIESTDIDITTNATPKQIKEIFPEALLSNREYGSVTLMVKAVRFEITTFRREQNYLDNRRPESIEYIDSLEEDLKRRDFTINTLCLDKSGQVLDLLNAKKDLEAKLIQTVGDPVLRFKEDSLRILRAVRFATTLGFLLSKDVMKAIKKTRHLLKTLSYQRKREELDKIFASSHAKEGIRLLRILGLDRELQLPKLKKVNIYDDLIGIWSTLDVVGLYPFNNNEKELMKNINQAKKENNLSPIVLYRYGPYVNTVAGAMKGISKREITEAFLNLPIKSRKEIDVTSEEIMKCLGRGPGAYLKSIYEDLERLILGKKLENQKETILDYCKNNYN